MISEHLNQSQKSANTSVILSDALPLFPGMVALTGQRGSGKSYAAMQIYKSYQEIAKDINSRHLSNTPYLDEVDYDTSVPHRVREITHFIWASPVIEEDETVKNLEMMKITKRVPLNQIDNCVCLYEDLEPAIDDIEKMLRRRELLIKSIPSYRRRLQSRNISDERFKETVEDLEVALDLIDNKPLIMFMVDDFGGDPTLFRNNSKISKMMNHLRHKNIILLLSIQRLISNVSTTARQQMNAVMLGTQIRKQDLEEISDLWGQDVFPYYELACKERDLGKRSLPWIFFTNKTIRKNFNEDYTPGELFTLSKA